MTEYMAKLLLCTNGDPHTRPSLDYGVWLAGLTGKDVHLLGVVEPKHAYSSVESLIADASARLSQAGITFSTQIEQGNAPRVIAQIACQGGYLTVVGPLGRPAWRRVVHGRSFRRIMRRMPTPIIYVRKSHLKMERILLCMGGLGYAKNMESAAVELAKSVNAAVTLLHVVEPVTLAYPTAREIQDHWKKILETETPQGRNLNLAISMAQDAGLSVEFKVRRGNVVHEILEEAHSGNYDLVGLGSPYSAHSLRHIYMPNVTAEVAETLERPILTVR
jgi:nucleotide-binding universal stress UspA family protein